MAASAPDPVASLLRAAFSLADFDVPAAQAHMVPPYRGGPPPWSDVPGARTAAALLYLFESEGRLWFPLTLRRDDLREHRGQVALPGGRPEPGESSWQTALREAFEEVRLDPALPESVGRLRGVYIPPTHTVMSVHVAVGPLPGDLVPEVSEVADLTLVALDELLDEERTSTERREWSGRAWDVPFFDLAGWSVWGATAIALSELKQRLLAVGFGTLLDGLG